MKRQIRQRARVDKTQPEIVGALRKAGYSVALTHAVGSGFPDCVVSKNGLAILLELKSPGGKLRTSQVAFADSWNGIVETASTIAEALAVAQIHLGP